MEGTAGLVFDVITAAATTIVAIVAFFYSRRSGKLQATLAYQRQWFDLSMALATDSDLRDRYIALNDGNEKFGSGEVRLVYLILGQALQAFHLYKSGNMKRDYYKAQVEIAVSVLGDALARHADVIAESAYPREFMQDLRKAQQRSAS
ncbi:MAG: hypothetical protein AAF850_10835 [Pseudomonadota bacterium]